MLLRSQMSEKSLQFLIIKLNIPSFSKVFYMRIKYRFSGTHDSYILGYRNLYEIGLIKDVTNKLLSILLKSLLIPQYSKNLSRCLWSYWEITVIVIHPQQLGIELHASHKYNLEQSDIEKINWKCIQNLI